MKILNKNNVQDLIRGSSLLACGGGLSYREQNELISLLHLTEVRLVDPEDISQDSMSITIAELGPADAPPLDHSKVSDLVEFYEKHTNNKVSYILPGEIGQEAVTLSASSHLGIPIIDSDLAGGRSVPALSDIAIIKKFPDFTMTPLAVMTADSNFEFIPKQPSIQQDENKLRTIVSKYPGQVLLFAGGSLSGAFIKTNLNYRSYSLAMSIGSQMKNNEYPPSELSQIQGPVILKVIQIKEIQKDGFIDKEVILSSDEKSYTLWIENEFMSLKTSDTNHRFPDLITLYDPIEKIGVSSGNLDEGDELILTVFASHPFWD